MTDLGLRSKSRFSVWSVAKAVLLLAVLVALLSLGTWQVYRLHWKESLLADISERRTAPPEPLAAIEKMNSEGSDIEYRNVTVTGHFLNDKERHFFSTWNGTSGFNVYTPLALDDGRFLLVNRGFVPYDLKDAAKRPQGELQGEQTITGLARERLDKKPSWLLPENDISKNIFYWKDLSAMAASDGLDTARVLPFFVDADAKANPGGLPVGGVTIIDLPNDHLQYAVTWYGLAAALVAITAVFWYRKRYPAAPSQ